MDICRFFNNLVRDADIHVGNVIVSDSQKEVFDNKDGGQ